MSNDELFEKYRAGDHTACAAIVENNLGLVSFTIRKYFSWIYTKNTSNSMTLEDLNQEGVIGLICSVESYDPEKGSFATHAITHINKEILKALRDKDNIIKIPAPLKTEYNKLRKLEMAYMSTYHAEPTTAQLSKFARIDYKRIEMLKQVFAPIGSLDVPIGDDESDYLGSRISDGYNHFEDVDKGITIKNLHEDLEGMMEASSENKKDLRGFKLYMGWNDRVPGSFDEIGKKLGVPKDEVKGSVNKILRKMKKDYSGKLSVKYADLISYRLARTSSDDIGLWTNKELVYSQVSKNIQMGNKLRVSDKGISIDGVVDLVTAHSFRISYWSNRSGRQSQMYVEYEDVIECKFFRGEMLEVCIRGYALERYIQRFNC